ncbi:hypothetical protein [uncultured Paraglaciecola sp.]|uniref:hypothetical protein n=1 Tax=uncultured Paraglaciecola sp. TaxID=1765024 RepID=UPI002620C5EB|nr:hypothetical protein [uncultured Paraglaciecola sp.]
MGSCPKCGKNTGAIWGALCPKCLDKVKPKKANDVLFMGQIQCPKCAEPANIQGENIDFLSLLNRLCDHCGEQLIPITPLIDLRFTPPQISKLFSVMEKHGFYVNDYLTDAVASEMFIDIEATIYEIRKEHEANNDRE